MEILVLEDDYRAKPSPECAFIDEFRKIIQRDRGSKGDTQGRSKQRAAKELAYIYHLCSHESPYAQYNEQLRIERVKQDLFRDEEWSPDELIYQAINKYEELTKTPLIRLLDAAVEGVQKLQKYFQDLDFGELDANGKPIYKANELVSSLSNLGKVVEGLGKLREQVDKEQLATNRNRKGVTTNKYSE